MVRLHLFKKSKGLAALEASLTLPIIVLLIFFILEMLKVNNAQTAIDSIATEATFDFIVNRNTNNFAAIRDKYLPKFIDASRMKWYFAIYKDLSTMCSAPPYGGEEIYWPTGDTMMTNPADYIDSNKDGSFLVRTNHMNITNCEKPELSFNPAKTEDDFKSLSGKTFVLTVVCDYQFSSDMIGKAFFGGSNTKGGSKFLIWGRGIGICN